VSYQDETPAEAQARRTRRDIEWDEEHRERPPAASWPEQEWPGPAGFGLAGQAPYPDALDGIPPDSGQPAAVLLSSHMPRHYKDPLTVSEEAAAEAADARAVAELDAGITRVTDARAELRKMPRRNPDGTNLSGGAAKDWVRRAEARMRQLELGGVGHEPGVAP